jgi:tetratricopeptide (TPR) repeat protein
MIKIAQRMKPARMMDRISIAFVVVSCLCALGAAPARATTPAIESELVQQGVIAYNDLEYPQAIKLLSQALQETLTLQEKRVTYITLAFSYFALNQPEETITAFENLLRVDERFEPDRTIAPRARALFEKARARLATGKSAGGSAPATMPTLSPTVTPVPATEGQPVEVRVRYPGGAAQKIDVFYRTRGQARFSELVAPLDGRGGAALTVPGMSVRAPALEYYLLALDDTGASVARAGSLAQPLPIDVLVRRKPVYKRGWFWGTIAAVLVAGAGAATIFYFTRPQITSTTPGTVTFQPQ